MLDYSQINSSNFRKNIKEFNIIDTVNEIMSLQQMKADDLGIELKAVFNNIGFSFGQKSPLIVHDENRIKQVLLNL